MNTHILLARGVADAIEQKSLEKILASGAKLRVKLGIDPTAPDLHLGHTVPLRKLREFQNAGHQGVLIIGDFTAMIGDPSGRQGAREPLTKGQVEKNLARFSEQAGKILNMKALEVRYNSEWFGKILLAEWLEIQSKCTIAQIIDRSDFAERLKAGKPVGLHELSYPLLQAYDSVAVRADIELGGVDQRLNLIAGRELMEKMGLSPQHIIMTPLLIGTDGERKMSKSFGNYIGLNNAPNDMFGKVMAIPDALTPSYFELLTDILMPKDISARDAKLLLARAITGMYHGKAAGDEAEAYFIKTFSKKEIPEDISELKVESEKLKIVDLLMRAGVKSKSEARRLINGGAIAIGGEKKEDPDEEIVVHDGVTLTIGKRIFFKITTN